MNRALEPENITMQRLDLYRPIHKAIRLCLLNTVTRVGNMDETLDADVREAAEAVRTLLAMLAAHIVNEDVVHRAVERRMPGASAALAQAHEEHASELRKLEDAVSRLESAAPHERQSLAHALYLELSRFAGENLVHMNIEETQMNPLLWSLFSEAELYEIYNQILAAEPPEQLAAGVRWLVPALTHAERVAVIQGARAGIPPAVFEQLVAGTRALLSERDYERLRAALGMEQAAA
jgi:hypothetical protein